MATPRLADFTSLNDRSSALSPFEFLQIPQLLFRRRRTLACLAVLTLLMSCAIAPVLFGNNARRVRIQHGGVQLPLSARNLNCGGCSLVLGGGVATATFTINPGDLQLFLSQFQVQTSAEEPVYFSGTFTADGIFDGVTPAGNDRVHLTWTTACGEVQIDLSTDSN